jgi:hypothetical protein
MRKISAETPSNPQQKDLGMKSNALIPLDVATMTGAGCTTSAAGLSWTETPAGLGSGCAIGDAATFGGTAMVGGDRRGGETAGIREGRGIRAISCFAPSLWRPGTVSGLGGSALLTGSFFGSAMADHVAPRKISENSLVVTLTFPEFDFSTLGIQLSEGRASARPILQ